VLPLIVGNDVFTGAARPVTTAVGADVAFAEATMLLAVTSTSRVEPTSEDPTT
jgi:hypothetical protein